MGRGFVVLGFFVLILTIIAGCSSIQRESSTGSNSQNPVQGNAKGGSPYDSGGTLQSDCKLAMPDASRFEKFLPDVPGWVVYNKSTVREKDKIAEVYVDGPPYLYTTNIVAVEIADKGPCVTGSTGVNALLDAAYDRKRYFPPYNDTSRIANFHGYPAVKITLFIPSSYTNSERIFIGINNRLMVSLKASRTSETFTLSEADAIIEKFANAIDFNGIAASD